MADLTIGLIVLAASIVGLFVCRANKDGTKKVLLRGVGLETLVGIAITGGFGFGLSMAVAGAATVYGF